MRLCPLSPRLAAAAAAASASFSVFAALPAEPAAALDDPPAPPACVGADARAFPLAARIRGGPAFYEAGGGYGTWYIDLKNTTRRTCTGVHPVIVLVDDRRTLKPEQPELDFYDGATPRPVRFESTDEEELVGVMDGAGFDGFAVPPGRTVSVKVRLALPSDTAADRVTVNAAVVQRRGDDGDWVGESNAYRFEVGQEDTTEEGVRPSPSGSVRATPGTDTSDPSLPFAEAAEEAGERARELATTGPALAQGLLAAAAAVLGVGGGALLLARRARRRR